VASAQRLDRSDHIIADAATDQFAVKGDVVQTANDNDPSTGIANRRKLIEAGKDIAATIHFQDDDVGRRR